MTEEPEDDFFSEGPSRPRSNRTLYAVAAAATLVVAIIRGVTLLNAPEKNSVEEQPPPPAVEPITPSPKPLAPKPTIPGLAGLPESSAATAPHKEMRAEQMTWLEYMDALKKGQADRAVEAWGEWRSAAEALEGMDWKARLATYWPKEKQRTVVMYSTCASCFDGNCEECHGKGKCGDCDGKRICENCKGARQFVQPCLSCLCSACRQTGHCQTCQGYGKTTCNTCNGSGLGKPIVNTRPCGACGGKGVQKRRYRDTVFTCPVCRGHGKFVNSRNTACPTCKGEKALPCDACQSSGLCSNCRGTRRNLSCTSCKGTGTLVTICSECSGSGNCRTCDGSGLCKTCRGLAKCNICLGNSAHPFKRLIASMDFLPPDADGIVQDDQGWRTFTLPDSDATPKVDCAGRTCTLEKGEHIFHMVSDRNAFHLTKPDTAPAPNRLP